MFLIERHSYSDEVVDIHGDHIYWLAPRKALHQKESGAYRYHTIDEPGRFCRTIAHMEETILYQAFEIMKEGKYRFLGHYVISRDAFFYKYDAAQGRE